MLSIIYFGDGRWQVGAMGIDAFRMLTWVIKWLPFPTTPLSPRDMETRNY